MRFSTGTLVITFALGLSACSPASLTFRGDQSNSTNTGQGSPATASVCQPGTYASSTSGLSGNMYYLNPGSSPLSSVDAYIQTGIKASSLFYFNTLDVPDESWTLGFQTATGVSLTTNSGTLLTENYALDLHSQIVLGSLPKGDYEFGLISDDGSILSTVDSAGQENIIVNDDGTHSARFACASQTVHFDGVNAQNVHIKYYQGPRNDVAIIVLWKQIVAGGKIDTEYCGDSGNTLFFDPAQNPPTPQPEYKNLLARGWAPLQATNYDLPTGETNPCAN